MGRNRKPPGESLTQLPCKVSGEVEREVMRIGNNLLGKFKRPAAITRALLELGLYVAQHHAYLFEVAKRIGIEEPHLQTVLEDIVELSRDIYTAPPIALPSPIEESRELKPAGRITFLPRYQPILTQPTIQIQKISQAIRSDAEHELAAAAMRERWSRQKVQSATRSSSDREDV